MPAYKYTAKRGETNRAQIAIAAGAAEAQPETISVNIDVTSATSLARGDVIILLDNIKAKILAEPWPPLA